jgi:hypothetical protein
MWLDTNLSLECAVERHHHADGQCLEVLSALSRNRHCSAVSGHTEHTGETHLQYRFLLLRYSHARCGA